MGWLEGNLPNPGAFPVMRISRTPALRSEQGKGDRGGPALRLAREPARMEALSHVPPTWLHTQDGVGGGWGLPRHWAPVQSPFTLHAAMPPAMNAMMQADFPGQSCFPWHAVRPCTMHGSTAPRSQGLAAAWPGLGMPPPPCLRSVSVGFCSASSQGLRSPHRHHTARSPGTSDHSIFHLSAAGIWGEATQ